MKTTLAILILSLIFYPFKVFSFLVLTLLGVGVLWKGVDMFEDKYFGEEDDYEE